MKEEKVNQGSVNLLLRPANTKRPVCYSIAGPSHRETPTSISWITPFPYTGQRFASTRTWVFTKVRRDLSAHVSKAPHHGNGPSQPLSHTQRKRCVYFQWVSRCVCFASVGRACLIRKKREPGVQVLLAWRDAGDQTFTAASVRSLWSGAKKEMAKARLT